MKSMIAALTSAGRSSWVIWPQPGSMITPRSCGANFGKSAMWRSKSASPPALPSPSLCGGVGAQSLFALAKRGRCLALASLLVKTEVGVVDADN
jgi:hypothetical protein